MAQNRPGAFSSLRMGGKRSGVKLWDNQTDWLMPAEVIHERVQDGVTGETKDMQYSQCKIVGNGSFGVVFQTKLSGGEDAAIKRVLQDKRFKVPSCTSMHDCLLTPTRIASCKSCESCDIQTLSNSKHSITQTGKRCVLPCSDSW